MPPRWPPKTQTTCGWRALAARKKTRAAALPEKCQPAWGTMPPYTVVPGGKGVVPMIKCSISALQALTLAGYQPTGNIRSRVRMVASFYGGPLIRVGGVLAAEGAYRWVIFYATRPGKAVRTSQSAPVSLA